MADEPKLGANRGNAGKGRPKGSPNKTTTIAKEAIALAADKLGGVERLVAWAKEDEKNEHSFWSSIYPRLLPLQVNADLAGSIVHTVAHKIIDDNAHN
jgi:hypothetical protein